MNRMIDLEKFAGDTNLFHILDGSSFLAIIPYANMWRSFTNEIFSAEFTNIYTFNGMTPILVNYKLAKT